MPDLTVQFAATVGAGVASLIITELIYMSMLVTLRTLGLPVSMRFALVPFPEGAPSDQKEITSGETAGA